MNRIPFVRHRTAHQIRAKYRACRHPVEKVRWHAVWLLSRTDEPRTPAQVAGLVGLPDVTVRAILHRWNASGPDGLADGRRGNGSEPELSARRRAALYAALLRRPPDGGLWTGPKVARYARDRWRIEVGPVTGWRWLRDLGFTPQVPARPTRRRPTGRPGGGGKKPTPAGKAAEAGAPGPGGRGVGRGRGEARPQAGHPPGVVAAGVPAPLRRADAVRVALRLRVRPPATGETFTVILPRAKVERMADALAAFAAHADPGGEKLLVLVVDRAGWHTAKRLAVPANIRLHFLPPCTPQLQPVEPFRALVREAVANDTFERLADLRRRIARRCRRLAGDRATVPGAIGFRWAVNLES